jgi:hypothetical protein
MENELDTLDNISEIQKLNPFKRFWVGLLLWIVSIILKYFAFAFGLIFQPIYYLITLKWKSGFGQIGVWFFNMALSNDQGGNVQNSKVFELLFTKDKTRGAKYGNPDDTVSFILATNHYKNNLTRLGRWLGYLLNKIDPNNGGHLYKSIIAKIIADQEAINRIHENKYFR